MKLFFLLLIHFNAFFFGFGEDNTTELSTNLKAAAENTKQDRKDDSTPETILENQKRVPNEDDYVDFRQVFSKVLEDAVLRAHIENYTEDTSLPERAAGPLLKTYFEVENVTEEQQVNRNAEAVTSTTEILPKIETKGFVEHIEHVASFRRHVKLDSDQNKSGSEEKKTEGHWTLTTTESNLSSQEIDRQGNKNDTPATTEFVKGVTRPQDNSSVERRADIEVTKENASNIEKRSNSSKENDTSEVLHERRGKPDSDETEYDYDENSNDNTRRARPGYYEPWGTGPGGNFQGNQGYGFDLGYLQPTAGQYYSGANNLNPAPTYNHNTPSNLYSDFLNKNKAVKEPNYSNNPFMAIRNLIPELTNSIRSDNQYEVHNPHYNSYPYSPNLRSGDRSFHPREVPIGDDHLPVVSRLPNYFQNFNPLSQQRYRRNIGGAYSSLKHY